MLSSRPPFCSRRLFSLSPLTVLSPTRRLSGFLGDFRCTEEDFWRCSRYWGITPSWRTAFSWCEVFFHIGAIFSIRRHLTTAAVFFHRRRILFPRHCPSYPAPAAAQLPPPRLVAPSPTNHDFRRHPFLSCCQPFFFTSPLPLLFLSHVRHHHLPCSLPFLRPLLRV